MDIAHQVGRRHCGVPYKDSVILSSDFMGSAVPYVGGHTNVSFSQEMQIHPRGGPSEGPVL